MSVERGGRRAALAFIFVTVLLDVISFGIIIPVLPKLIEGFVHDDMELTAKMYGAMGTVWAVMQFFFSPVQGALSDRFGRRAVLLTSNFGLALDFVVMALAPNLAWLFVGRAISGMTSASFSTAGAYIADVTPVEKRAQSFGMLGAAFGVGFVLGPAIGGVLGKSDPRMPFWLAAGMSMLSATYGFFVLPESLPKDKRSLLDWRRANPIGALGLLRSHPDLASLSVVLFLADLGHVVLPSTSVLYMGYRYHWEPREVGLTLAGVGVCSMIVSGGLVRPIVKKLGERLALVMGLVFGVAGFTIYALASTWPVFVAGIPVMALWGVAGPAAQAMMTKRVAPTQQGQLQGAASSIMGICGVIGPSLFTTTFAAFIGPLTSWGLPGAPFLLAALLLLAAVPFALRTTESRGDSAIAPIHH